METKERGIRVRCALAMTGAAACLLAGCAEAPEAGAPEQPAQAAAAQRPDTLLEKLELTSGNAVEFHKIGDADILVFEEGKYPNPPVKLPSSAKPRTAVEIFKLLAPERQVPAKLKLAQDEIEGFRSAHPDPVAPAQPSDTQAVQQLLVTANVEPVPDWARTGAFDGKCPASWFQSNFCGTGFSTHECWLNKTNNYSPSYSGATSYNIAACSYRGTINFLVQHKAWWAWFWDYDFSRDIPAGSFVHALNGDDLGRTLQIIIAQADGDGWNEAVNVSY
jgi:hypothetical protein